MLSILWVEKRIKKEDVWTSKVDVVVASWQLMYDIVNSNEYQAAFLLTDHAPVTLETRLPRVNLSVLEVHASKLGNHSSIMWGEQLGGGVRCPVCFSAINPDLFITGIRAA